MIAPGGTVMLDDAARPGERFVARRWRKAHPDFDFRMWKGGIEGDPDRDETPLGSRAAQPSAGGASATVRAGGRNQRAITSPARIRAIVWATNA